MSAANRPNSLWSLESSFHPSVSLPSSLYLRAIYTCLGQHAHHLFRPPSVHESAAWERWSQFSAHSAEPPESSNSSGCSIQPLSGSNYVLSSAFLHALVLTPSVE
ncbi:hypothetical protein I311_01600 [Cryptococcus gattii NT-10]|nr:hypothetical protein I311_01600 [Cryptococcus gattii NT-10]